MVTRSRIVAWLRVVMPLAALVLLSVLFLLGRKPEPGSTIPYADVDPQELAQNSAVTAPNYAGVTPNGSEVTLTAERAKPNASGSLESIDVVRMTLTSPEGRKANLDAGKAQMQGDDVRLTGDVRLTTEDGWTVTAPEFLAGLREGTLSADQEVNVTAPFGELTAGRMDLRPTEGGNHVLDLNGGVRLIYRP